MEYFKQAVLLLITQQCYDEYFVEFNFFDVPCFKATLSKGLGLGIIAGSLMVKIPQILKILKNKSGTGISLLSVTLDLTAITIVAAYSYVSSFPFSAWGDGAFMALQTVAVGFLVFYYNRQTLKAFAYVFAYLVISYIAMGGFTPRSLLWTLQGVNIPIVLAGKLTQAYENYKNGGTGQLSAVTVFMLLAGSSARIFTSIQETGDTMMVLLFCVSTFANGIIAAQMIYYWNVIDKKKKLKHKKSK